MACKKSTANLVKLGGTQHHAPLQINAATQPQKLAGHTTMPAIRSARKYQPPTMDMWVAEKLKSSPTTQHAPPPVVKAVDTTHVPPGEVLQFPDPDYVAYELIPGCAAVRLCNNAIMRRTDRMGVKHMEHLGFSPEGELVMLDDGGFKVWRRYDWGITQHVPDQQRYVGLQFYKTAQLHEFPGQSEGYVSTPYGILYRVDIKLVDGTLYTRFQKFMWDNPYPNTEGWAEFTLTDPVVAQELVNALQMAVCQLDLTGYSAFMQNHLSYDLNTALITAMSMQCWRMSPEVDTNAHLFTNSNVITATYNERDDTHSLTLPDGTPLNTCDPPCEHCNGCIQMGSSPASSHAPDSIHSDCDGSESSFVTTAQNAHEWPALGASADCKA